ncbi:MAG TPA: Gldg family protein [Nitrospiria bacterium]
MIKQLSKLSGWLGLFLFFGGLLALGVNPSWGNYVSIAEGASLVLLIFFFITHFEAIKVFSTRRSTQFGLNSFLMVVIFLSIIGILNFLSSRHNQRLDLSETGRFSLAPQTKKVLQNLEQKVKITAFTESQTPSENQIRDLLNSYSNETDHLSFQVIDPSQKPAIARQYGITQYNTLVIEVGDQETQIKNIIEQELTNALIRVNKKKKQTIHFLEGHGEHDLTNTEREGFSRVQGALEKQGYHVEGLSLLQTGKIPEDTAVLVVAGPQKAFLPQEIEAVSNYLNQKGKVLALIDPQTQTNLDVFFSQWGIRLGPGIIVDTLSRLFGGDLTIPVVTTYPNHEITEGFNLATFFPVAQRVQFESSDSHLNFQSLAETTENSWTKTDIISGDLNFNSKTDLRGPLTLAGMVTKKTEETSSQEESDLEIPSEENTDQPSDEPILIVFGDSDFAANGSFDFNGNGDLILNTINFLAKEKNLIAITPKKPNFSPLFLTKVQGNVVFYTSVILMPGIVFLTGLIIWKRRRRL